jgi:Uncharacterized protein conserved in bacteria
MEKEKYLPVGTVVMLKGGKKRAMITGFCTSSNDNTEKVFDYSGCLYPEGFLSSEQTLLFDHEQIVQIYYMGLIDEEEEKFKAHLKEVMSKIDDLKSVVSVVENNN